MRRLIACVVIAGLLGWGSTSYLWAMELAHWRIDECHNVFRLLPDNPRCRVPVLWAYSGIAEVVAALIAGVYLAVRAVRPRAT